MQVEAMERKALLSALPQLLTMGTYREVKRELGAALGETVATQNLQALGPRLAAIAAQVPFGKSQLLPSWNHTAQAFNVTATQGAKYARGQLISWLRFVVQDDVALGVMHLVGRGSQAVTASLIPNPPFAVGTKFNVSGTNFLGTYSNNMPTLSSGPQSLDQGRLRLTINTINDSNGTSWTDFDFQNPSTPGRLAGNMNARWQAGPIGGIQLTSRVRLNNLFFYFTRNGVPVSGNLRGIPNDIYVGQNPISVMRRQIPQVFFFNNFRPGFAQSTLNLGSGVSSGSLTFASFLKQLNVPSDVNGIHIDFQASWIPVVDPLPISTE
jgi:hypothetical protein